MLSRRWLINFGLVFLVILFTFIGNKYDVKTGYQSDLRIIALNADDVDSILIQMADSSIALQRQPSGWMIERPLQWPANNINVERMLGITRSETDSRLASAEIDLNSIGLQFPKALLRLNDSSILFGNTNNIGERRYILIDKTVFLLPDIHLPFIAQGLFGVIDRRMLPRSLDLTGLQLDDITLQRDSNGSWQDIGPTGLAQQQVQMLVDNWQGLEASKIKAFDNNAIPRSKIIAQLADGRSLEFFLMSLSPDLVIAHPEIELQYHYNANFYYQLLDVRDQ